MLDTEGENREKQEKIARVLDDIRGKYGRDALAFGGRKSNKKEDFLP
jgi:hypothetical protein